MEELHSKLKEWEASYASSTKTECSSKWKLHADFIHATYQSIQMGLIQRKAREAELNDHKIREEARQAASQLTEVLALAFQQPWYLVLCCHLRRFLST